MKLIINKRLTAVILAGAMVFSAAGCSGGKVKINDSNVTEVVESAKTLLGEISESKSELKTDFVLTVGEVKSELSDIAEVTDRKEPMLKHVTTTTVQDGQPMTGGLDAYIGNIDGIYTIFAKYGTEWYKQQIENYSVGYYLGQYYILENTKIMLDAADNFKYAGEETLNEKPVYKVTCEIPADKAYAVVEGTGAFLTLGFSNLEESLFTLDGAMPINLWLDAETGKIVKFEADYTKALASVLDNIYAQYETDAQKITTEKYLLTVTINEGEELGDFAIPEDIKNAPDFSESLQNGTEGEIVTEPTEDTPAAE